MKLFQFMEQTNPQLRIILCAYNYTIWFLYVLKTNLNIAVLNLAAQNTMQYVHVDVLQLVLNSKATAYALGPPSQCVLVSNGQTAPGRYCLWYHTDTILSEIFATVYENGSQITCYAVNGDWLFIIYYVLTSIDHVISVQHLVLQELWKPQPVAKHMANCLLWAFYCNNGIL